jgi:hypothetical protein
MLEHAVYGAKASVGLLNEGSSVNAVLHVIWVTQSLYLKLGTSTSLRLSMALFSTWNTTFRF